jgi:hypothetical protein
MIISLFRSHWRPSILNVSGDKNSADISRVTHSGPLSHEPNNKLNFIYFIFQYISNKMQTLHSLFISGNCSTCFGWYFHPSSGAHTTVSTACGISQTVTAICVAFTTHHLPTRSFRMGERWPTSSSPW